MPSRSRCRNCLPPIRTVLRASNGKQVLASLNHPNIGAIHGIEEARLKPATVYARWNSSTGRRRGADCLRPLPPTSVADRPPNAAAFEAAHDTGSSTAT